MSQLSSAENTPVLSVVLTSRKNFVWQSMQEIIPWIEASWKASASATHQVEVFNVDDQPLAAYLPRVLRARNVVLTCFTHKLCQVAARLRKELSVEARYLIYLHNQATIACWPFHQWGLGEALRADDIFLSSCTRDALALGLSFERARVRVLPFGLQEEAPPFFLDGAAPAGRIPFVFVGRVSEQKNLHTLLSSAALLSEANPGIDFDLTIFGAEDGLGSPNMGFEFQDYGRYLEAMSEDLGIDGKVRFRGHVDRDRIAAELSGSKHIFVSASIHSDENFGMAAFRSLCTGNSAVLTDWGGHADFEPHFKGRVFLTRVHGSEVGPFVRPSELAREMLKAAKSYRGDHPVGIPEYFRKRSIAAELSSLASEPLAPGARLKQSALAARVQENRARYLQESPRQSKIFSSYADPLARPFLKAYGMSDGFEAKTPGHENAHRLLPWVSVKGNEWIAEDPHRGKITMNWSSFSQAEQLRRALGLGFADEAGQTPR